MIVKKYNRFKINHICKKYEIENYTINSDGSISVDGDVRLYRKGLTKLPVKFREVSGGFWCDENFLTNLEGAPTIVGGTFECSDNNITSLKGTPERTGGWFGCTINKLTSLEGCPKYVSNTFYCQENNIYTFEGIPDFTHIGADFVCWGNLVNNIWQLFEDHTKFEFFNDCSPIRWMDEKPTVILDRLNFFLEETGHKTVENVEGYINI